VSQSRQRQRGYGKPQLSLAGAKLPFKRQHPSQAITTVEELDGLYRNITPGLLNHSPENWADGQLWSNLPHLRTVATPGASNIDNRHDQDLAFSCSTAMHRFGQLCSKY